MKKYNLILVSMLLSNMIALAGIKESIAWAKVPSHLKNETSVERIKQGKTITLSQCSYKAIRVEHRAAYKHPKSGRKIPGKYTVMFSCRAKMTNLGDSPQKVRIKIMTFDEKEFELSQMYVDYYTSFELQPDESKGANFEASIPFDYIDRIDSVEFSTEKAY